MFSFLSIFQNLLPNALVNVFSAIDLTVNKTAALPFSGSCHRTSNGSIYHLLIVQSWCDINSMFTFFSHESPVSILLYYPSLATGLLLTSSFCMSHSSRAGFPRMQDALLGLCSTWNTGVLTCKLCLVKCCCNTNNWRKQYQLDNLIVLQSFNLSLKIKERFKLLQQ